MPKKKDQPVDIYIGLETIGKGKNVDGHLGEKCNYCGGFGFTVGLGGTNLSCKDCDGTGVKLPTIRELQTQISQLREDLHLLKKALLETLQSKGLTIKTDVTKANHV